MYIDPRLIESHVSTGLGNMGDSTDVNSRCRWRIPGAIYVPVFLRAQFTSGTGSATLSIRRDMTADDTNLYDFVIKQVLTAGTDGKANVYLSYLADELATFPFFPGDDLVLEWTNPDSGTMRWAVEVGLYDAANLR